MRAQLNFIRQQGFREATADVCPYQYPALMWQPRIIWVILVIGLLFQSPLYFAAIAALLLWSAVMPRFNPFDALYNRVFARRGGGWSLGVAPPPRRFAQAMAGSFMIGIAAALFVGSHWIAWALEAVLTAAVGALVFGRFCLGSYVFHLVSGEARFANRTLPWSQADPGT